MSIPKCYTGPDTPNNLVHAGLLYLSIIFFHINPLLNYNKINSEILERLVRIKKGTSKS